MFLKRYLVVAFFGLAFFPGFSQETTVPVMDNPVLTNAEESKSLKFKSLKLQDTLSLPFFDDFSGSLSPYPKASLWLDSFVFINDSWPVNPLSIGVATFDAIDRNGKIYVHATDMPFIADVLTSKPINMSYPPASNAYLSFYYQPQGLGDTTEIQDSLMVDFYNPASKKWWNVWRVSGSGLHPFKAVILPIQADSFLVRGFQFRFRNFASIKQNNFDQGKMGDVDHWHIDYVKLDINRTANDTIIRDVAFSKPVGSLLKIYQSMPWKQFQVAFQNVMRKDISITYRNNDTIGHKPDRYFEISDLNGDHLTSFYSGNENINPQEVYNFTTNLEYPFFTDETDSARFEVKSFLRTEPYDIKINDTTRFIQVFSNYFAYDDGTPEQGYGLSGQGTINGMVALKFTSYFADSLSAVKIFFNSTKNDASSQFNFRLTLWNAANSGPGTIIYQATQQTPKALGKYTTYMLDSAIILNGDFYVGWQQPNEDFLNVGMDKNNSTPGSLFYNTGSWYKSSFDNAALMIRLVFGSKGLVSNTGRISREEFTIYPNPTSGVLNISYPEPGTFFYATLLNNTGKVILQGEVNNGTLNLEDLPSGLYFLILTENGKAIYKGKVIVQH
jgi:hypothetical protein